MRCSYCTSNIWWQWHQRPLVPGYPGSVLLQLLGQLLQCQCWLLGYHTAMCIVSQSSGRTSICSFHLFWQTWASCAINGILSKMMESLVLSFPYWINEYLLCIPLMSLNRSKTMIHWVVIFCNARILLLKLSSKVYDRV